MVRRTPQVAYADYQVVQMTWWSNLYSSVCSNPPVVHSFLGIVLHPLDSALFQIGLRVLLYVIDVIFVLVQNRMEVIPYDLVFSCTVNAFLESQV